MGNTKSCVFKKSTQHNYAEHEENDLKVSKVYEYSEEEWMRVKTTRERFGLDHCTRCMTSVIMPFYWSNCFGVHSEEHLKTIKHRVYNKLKTIRFRGERVRPDDLVKLCIISCNWDAAVVSLELRSAAGRSSVPRQKLLFYSHKDDNLSGEYDVPEGNSVMKVHISPSGQTFVIHEAQSLINSVVSLDQDDLISTFRCIQFTNQTPTVLDEVAGFHGGCSGTVLAFDPRYAHGRVACYVPQPEQYDTGLRGPALVLYSIDKHCVIRYTSLKIDNSPKRHRVFLSHNPDGTTISLLINDCLRDEIRLYDADNLVCTSRLPCCFSAKSSLCSFPAFSMCGMYASVVDKTDHGKRVSVYRITKTVQTLQTICRSSVIRTTAPECVNRLPIPKQLITFIKFGHRWE